MTSGDEEELEDRDDSEYIGMGRGDRIKFFIWNIKPFMKKLRDVKKL